MKKLTFTQNMMCKKLLSLFKSNDDIKTVKQLHEELIGNINFSINSTFTSFIIPLLDSGYLDIINESSLLELPLGKLKVRRCY